MYIEFQSINKNNVSIFWFFFFPIKYISGDYIVKLLT